MEQSPNFSLTKSRLNSKTLWSRGVIKNDKIFRKVWRKDGKMRERKSRENYELKVGEGTTLLPTMLITSSKKFPSSFSGANLIIWMFFKLRRAGVPGDRSQGMKGWTRNRGENWSETGPGLANVTNNRHNFNAPDLLLLLLCANTR